MKINFLSFLNPYRFSGGGELDNRMILEKGKSLGYDIKIASRVHNKYLHRLIHPRFDLHKSPDIWILSDLFNVPEYSLSYKRGFLEEIIQNEPFVHLDNAYVDICSKGPLPCNGNKNFCKPGCGNSLRYDIYSKSLKNFFLSPLHAQTINQFFDNCFNEKSVVLRPLVDPDSFVQTDAVRDIDYLYVGTISKYKGYQNIKKRFANEGNFLFIGKNATGEKLFGRHIAYVHNKDLYKYFNRAKHFVHLPEWKEPMGRTIIEAALCGCKIISNENVGACSFDFDIANPDNIRGAADDFWKTIKTITS